MSKTIYFLRDGKIITRTSGITDPNPLWDDNHFSFKLASLRKMMEDLPDPY